MTKIWSHTILKNKLKNHVGKYLTIVNKWVYLPETTSIRDAEMITQSMNGD